MRPEAISGFPNSSGRRMMGWTIVVYKGDGTASVRIDRPGVSYATARNECSTYPPGWIWHIEPINTTGVHG